MCRQLSVTSFLLSKTFFTIFFFSIAAQASGQTNPNIPIPNSKEGKTYISGSIVLNEFRSVSLPIVLSDTINFTEKEESIYTREFPLTGQTYALAFTYGTYITENFKTELRYGKGIIDDTLDEILDININYYFNWYIGGTLPVTDNFSAYALVGVSFYDADMTRHETIRNVRPPGEQLSEKRKIQPSRFSLDDDLFGTKFSMSWMLGLDYKLDESWYLAFEYGRLLKDTASNIKVYQAGSQLRYEF
ncbi:MAG: opacity protein-like surface antigen [Oleiphilaceae bacterium]|jgi:opacity protein-like surface antigen